MNVKIDMLRFEQIAAKKNLPRKAIAIDMGVTYQSLCCTLNRDSISLYTACRIANVLDVDVEEIIVGKNLPTASMATVHRKKNKFSYDLDKDAIFKAMGKANMNGTAIAAKCGYSRQWFNHILHTGHCSMPTLIPIANALCVPADSLLVGGV